MDRPSPAEYQPALTPWRHAWRFAAMLALSGVVLSFFIEGKLARPWWLAADLLLGAASFVLVLRRREHPMAVAVVTNLLGTVSVSSSGPAVLANLSVATRRRPWEIASLALLMFIASSLFFVVQPFAEGDGYWLVAAVNAVFTVIALGWGMYLGSRRELFWELNHRAERAEAERDERADRAREHERARIAREMHDVLGHRISQISMHAGAMAFRTDLSAQEMREGVSLIQQNANDALTDLRGVLGVLRDTSTGVLVEPPQPTYADVPRLLADAREAGMRVDFDNGLAEVRVPGAVGRTLYRIIQEGLTNAGRHAPGAVVILCVSGGPGNGADVLVSNRLDVAGAGAPGSKLGLIGLRERAALSGGRLDHRVEDGHFVLRGWIPWPT